MKASLDSFSLRRGAFLFDDDDDFFIFSILPPSFSFSICGALPSGVHIDDDDDDGPRPLAKLDEGEALDW
jgi:hypothetical protein